MGKATGFLEYERKNAAVEEPLKRIRHFNEFRTPLPLEEQQKQGARCMECGVPFCQNGAMLAGMASGCPLHNLVPSDLLSALNPKILPRVKHIHNIILHHLVWLGNVFWGKT